MVSVTVPVALLLFVSVTWTGKLKLPAAVGVPEMMPLLATLRDSGKPWPTAQVYGGVPPLATKVWLYGVPTVAAGSALVTTDKLPLVAAIVTESELEAEICLESVTIRVNV